MNERYSFLSRLFDAIIIVLTLEVSNQIRVSFPLGKPAPNEVLTVPLYFLPITVIIWQLVFTAFQVYSLSHIKLHMRSFPRLIEGHLIAALTFMGILYIVHRDFSRLESAYFIIISLVLMLAYRFIWPFASAIVGANPWTKRKVLIIGTNNQALQIQRIITEFATAGLQFVGFVRHSHDEHIASEITAEQVLGDLDVLKDLVTAHNIREIIICDRSNDHEYLRQISDTLSSLPVNVRIAPDYSDLAYFHVTVEDFAGMPLVGLRYDMLTIWQRIVKRIFDIVGATLLLAAFSPLIILIAIAIKLDSPGPILFSQKRAGERGREFTMYKFRSMVCDAEQQITYSQNYKRANDPRVTRVGRFLRRTSLDEIPQFLNVLRGDMSLVGPRPELPQVVGQYSPLQWKRFEVPQGLTGWWQINGRADLSLYEHTDYDVFYIRNYSVWLDLMILARTPLAVLKGKGAF
ncbi:MAG: sugar transferase [Anaerolineae bacterium]|nr:sugar transferase [Anaerolineae bacterium]